MVIGLSPSAEAYLKPSVQATWETRNEKLESETDEPLTAS
jgi:hypothetical protein